MTAPEILNLEILEIMPRRGINILYKARQTFLDRIVILKTLPQELIASDADIEKFLFEARVVAKLQHSNIGLVYNFGECEGTYYFIMEYFSGKSLAEWIEKMGTFSEANALVFARTVGDALCYAWEKAQVIHHNLRTDNIYINDDGEIKITDLGVDRSMQMVADKAKTQEMILHYGIPNYAAPEQFHRDSDIDYRGDIYSIGAILYHMITGKIPFEGMSHLDVVGNLENGQIDDPVDLNLDISDAVFFLIERMMAKNSGDRPQNWHECLKDIRRVRQRQMPEQVLSEGMKSTLSRSPSRKVHA